MPKFVTPVNLNGNELQNAVIQNLATAPTAVTGKIYYDTAESVYKIYDGTNWINLFNDDDDFHSITSTTETANDDEIVIYDTSASAYRKQTKSAFISGTGGEANTASNAGTGTSVYYTKDGVDLQFNGITAGSSAISVSLDGTNHNVEIDIGSTVLETTDVDDTPVDSATTVPISSNWAYDHANATNPHSIDATAVGLGNVSNDAQIPLTQKGAANGVAELDSSGLVPSSQLPAYVDDVVEAADYASLPGTGETGKIYVTLDDNVTYRWSGSAYVEISSSLALGETSTTAYRGDRGATAYTHSQSSHADPSAITASGVTYENLNSNGDVGTGSTQVAAGDHTHTGMATKYSTAIGNGSDTDIIVTHSLNTRDVIVNVYDASSYEQVIADVAMTTVNTITVSFTTAPTSGEYRVVVIG